ncbi:MAG: hypothetical protein ACXW1M_07605 [Acidimicrobiia bacterium]
MGEAGLGPGEVGKEIAEHAKHGGNHREATGRDRIVTIIEAALLAVVALIAAWSGFAAAKWSTESRVLIAEAATARNQANTAELEGFDIRISDGLTFNAWLAASALEDPIAEERALRRFRPDFRVAFDAWIATDPDSNPDAPGGPQGMPEYGEPEVERARDLNADADRLFTEGEEAGITGDDYVRTTVYLATVLFLVGISSHFPVRGARYGLILIGVAILVFSAIQLGSLPKPT